MYEVEEGGAVAVAADEPAAPGRRRIWTVAVLAGAAVVLAVPVAAYALTRGPTPSPVNGGVAAPSVAAPSVTAAVAGENGPSAAPTPGGARGGISQAELRNATLTVPAWPTALSSSCRKGPVTFTNGLAKELALVGAPVYTDMNHDGTAETVVLVSCTPSSIDYQVIALDQDASGKITTFGQVLVSGVGHAGTDIMTIWSIAAGDNGQIRADVGEYRPCCSMAQASQHQWRTYGWNGTAFTQTGGPTAFGPNPKVTDLRIDAEPMTMTRQADGSWRGTSRITVHNDAGYPTPGPVEVTVSVYPAFTGTAKCQPTVPQSQCAVPAIAAHSTAVTTLEVTAPGGNPSGNLDLIAQADDPQGGFDPDRKPRTPDVTLDIKLS